MSRTGRVLCAVAVALSGVMTLIEVSAANAGTTFSSGDLVVEVDQQTATGNLVDPVDLVDYSTSGALGGFSVALPATSLVDYGGYENGGLITNSADGGNVVVAGYAPSSATVVGQTAPGTNHASADVIGVVGSTGSADTTTDLNDGTTGVEDTHYARSATIDAAGGSVTRVYLSGSQAVDELNPDATQTTDNFLTSSGTDNAYDLQIVNGNLYLSASASQSCANGSVDEVSGLPLGGPETQTPLVCSPTSGTGNALDTTHFSPEQFILLTNAGSTGSVETIYVADSYSSAGSASSHGAVEKYTCSSNCASEAGWSSEGYVVLPYPTGLTADVTSSGVNIFGTGGIGGSSGSKLYKIVDASCGSAAGDTHCATTTLTGNTLTTLATATGNNEFHGIAWAPTSATVPDAFSAQGPVTLTSTSGTNGLPLTLTSSGGSGTGAVSYAVASAGSANCAITGGGGTVTASTAGTCTLTVTKASDGIYLATSSTPTTVSFLTPPAPITLASTAGTVAVPLPLAYSGGSGTGAIIYGVTSAGSANCVISGDGVVTAAAAGTCTVTVSQASDGTYAANSSSPTTITFLPPTSGTPIGGDTAYSPGTPVLATITNGTSPAPWNEYQGDSSSPPYASQGPGSVLPTYTPGGATNTTDGVTEPNLSVYPGAGSGSDGTSGFTAPYPAGTVGTPGPDDGYCGTGDNAAETSRGAVPVRQPNGTTLPLSPAYFPHIVANADGSLTGYFDWRPKDTDEAIVVARSTDGGRSWTYEGEALESDPGNCPNADMNDDGEGHPNVVTVGNNPFLYTLPRAAGDQLGTGLLVHELSPTPSDPLNGVPSVEKAGIDPDDFASSTVSLANSSGTPATIPFTTPVGSGLDQLVPGEFVDATQNPTPNASQVIYCTTVNAQSLSGCLSASNAGLTIQPNDLIEQVIGVVETDGAGSAATSGAAATVGCGTGSTTPTTSGAGVLPCTVPVGPNSPDGDSGLASLTLEAAPASPSGSPTAFTATPAANNDLWMSVLNENAPNRLYIDGTTVYCSQANSEPTTKIEDCTTGANGSTQLTVNQGDPVITDPIVPATAEETTGLVAPDGIVGVLPSYPGAPAGATVVMYTEKIVSYFIVGDIQSPATQVSSTNEPVGDFGSNMTITMDPFFNTGSEPLSSGANTLYIGDNTTNAIAVVRCSADNSATGTLTGCYVTGSIGGTVAAGDAVPSKAYVAGPGAATALASALAETGEGSSTDPQKLLKNNEDLSLLRVAYTTDGIDFSTAGLANGGVISGADNGDVSASGLVNCTADSGAALYTDISDPCTIASPPNLNAYANNDSANGTASVAGGTDTGSIGNDAVEMRWVGTGGTIITNPDGSYGLFLSGAWENDGDSDAFNQVYYSSSTDGMNWSVPTPVISTDYSFAASVAGDSSGGPLGISAYYSGRAYDPTVVQNPNGTLTMVFAADRLPKSISSVGSTVGTNLSAQYTIGPDDPSLYRNILVLTLSSGTNPAVGTSTAVSSTATGSTPIDTPVSFTATVVPSSPGSGTPAGSVTFATIDGTVAGCASVALNGSTPDTATCTTNYAGPVDLDIQASYSGDSNYASSINLVSSTTTLTSSDNGAGIVVGEPVTYTATVGVAAPGSSTPTGTVTFSDSSGAITGCPSQSLTTVDTSQVATCTVAYSSPVSDLVTATYSGDANTFTSEGTLAETVSQAATTTSLSASDNGAGIVVGQPVTFTVDVGAVSPGAGVPTGTVTISDDSGPIAACTALALSAGTPDEASCETTYTTAMTRHLTAAYSGDTSFTESSSSTVAESVNPASTSTTLSASDNGGGIVVGQSVTFTAALAVTGPGAGTPTGTVTFADSADVLGPLCPDQSLSSVAGQLVATCTTAYPAALGSPDDVTATYAGDGNFLASISNTVGETVSAASTATTLTSSDNGAGIVVGQPVTYTATVGVAAPGSSTPTGTVTFSDSSGTITGCTSVALSGENPVTASCTTSFPTTGPEQVGATYVGDSNDAGSTANTVNELVAKDATTVILTASPDPAVTGTPTTLSAQVLVDAPGTGVPGGTVTFLSGTTPLCTGVALSGAGEAKCAVTYNQLLASPHTIIATYSGSPVDLAAASSPLSLRVTRATHVTLSATPSPSAFGHRVTLRADGLPGAATGTVTFSEGATLLCQVSIGHAPLVCAPSTPPAPGSYEVTATYSGDATFAPSAASTSFTVTVAATNVDLHVSPQNSPYGTSVSLIAGHIPALATGTLTFRVAGSTVCTLATASPNVTCTLSSPPAPGSYQVAVTYSGDGDYLGSQAAATLVVRKATAHFVASATPATVSTYSQYVNLHAANLPAAATGTVTFTTGSTTLCSGTVSGGSASCGVPPGLAERTYHVVAHYSGDANYTSASATTTFSVLPFTGAV